MGTATELPASKNWVLEALLFTVSDLRPNCILARRAYVHLPAGRRKAASAGI